MGQCTSKNEANGIFNQMKKSNRQLRTGVKFKDIEFGGFIGYSTAINDVYTPSGVKSEIESVPKDREDASEAKSEIEKVESRSS